MLRVICVCNAHYNVVHVGDTVKPRWCHLESKSIAYADWHMWTARCNVENGCCTLRLAYSILEKLTVANHTSSFASTAALHSGPLQWFTMAGMRRRSRRLSQLFPSAGRLTKRRWAQIQFQGVLFCASLLVFLRQMTMYLAHSEGYRRVFFFSFPSLAFKKSNLMSLVICTNNKLLNRWSCNGLFDKLYLYSCSGNTILVFEYTWPAATCCLVSCGELRIANPLWIYLSALEANPAPQTIHSNSSWCALLILFIPSIATLT